MPQRKWTWDRVADWFEAEGSTSIIEGRIATVEVVTQKVTRREVADAICSALRRSGLHPTIRQPKPYEVRCELTRRDEQECFLTRVLPRLTTKHKKADVNQVLQFLATKRRIVGGRRRIPAPCPQELT